MTSNKRIRVKDIMKSSFATINGNVTVMDALNEMKKLQTAVLVVNKRNENDYSGLRVGIERKSPHRFPIHILVWSKVDFYCHILYVNSKTKGNNEK